MAAASPMQGLQEEATCPICLEYYKDPVTTKCGHNFCRACITGCSWGAGRALRCPQCREICPQGDLRTNRQLQNIVELVIQLSVQREKPPWEGVLCEEHAELLTFFCVEDLRLICVVCRESGEHRSHTVQPMKQAVQGYTDIRGTLSRRVRVSLQTPEGIPMKYKEPVTLDADTAHACLTLSEAGRRVAHTWPGQTPPDHRKRFTIWESVLGTQGFSSGRHYWELEMLQDGGWRLGVAQESVSRNECFEHCPEEGVWAVEGVQNTYNALTSPRSSLSPLPPLRNLGVYLDYEGGRLSVYNASTMQELRTFSGATFRGRVCPYFWLWPGTDLRLV